MKKKLVIIFQLSPTGGVNRKHCFGDCKVTFMSAAENDWPPVRVNRKLCPGWCNDILIWSFARIVNSEKIEEDSVGQMKEELISIGLYLSHVWESRKHFSINYFHFFYTVGRKVKQIHQFLLFSAHRNFIIILHFQHLKSSISRNSYTYNPSHTLTMVGEKR